MLVAMYSKVRTSVPLWRLRLVMQQRRTVVDTYVRRFENPHEVLILTKPGYRLQKVCLVHRARRPPTIHRRDRQDTKTTPCPSRNERRSNTAAPVICTLQPDMISPLLGMKSCHSAGMAPALWHCQFSSVQRSATLVNNGHLPCRGDAETGPWWRQRQHLAHVSSRVEGQKPSWRARRFLT